MLTTGELNKAIMDTTMKMKMAFPELMKYLTEMPVTIPDSNDPEINAVALKDYHDSLLLLFENYAAGHTDRTVRAEKINN
jgi:hypothetical protein